MVKKINKDAESIIKLLSLGYKQKQIVQILNLKKQKVSYWAIKLREKKFETKKRRKKLKDIYLSGVIRWAKNKTTSSMSCRKISLMINSVLSKRNEVDDGGKPITISYRTISNYLKDYYGKPTKNKKGILLIGRPNEKKSAFLRRNFEKED